MALLALLSIGLAVFLVILVVVYLIENERLQSLVSWHRTALEEATKKKTVVIPLEALQEGSRDLALLGMNILLDDYAVSVMLVLNATEHGIDFKLPQGVGYPGYEGYTAPKSKIHSIQAFQAGSPKFWQDTAGTIPANKDGDPVGLITGLSLTSDTTG